MPTFLYQVHYDILTEPEDVQAMYDSIPVTDKKLHGSRAQKPDGTATWSSSAAHSPCSTGSISTWPELIEEEPGPELEIVDVDPSELEQVADDAPGPGSARW